MLFVTAYGISQRRSCFNLGLPRRDLNIMGIAIHGYQSPTPLVSALFARFRAIKIVTPSTPALHAEKTANPLLAATMILIQHAHDAFASKSAGSDIIGWLEPYPEMYPTCSPHRFRRLRQTPVTMAICCQVRSGYRHRHRQWLDWGAAFDKVLLNDNL